MSVVHHDLTLPIDEGLLNIRIGAIIIRGHSFLMVGNNRDDYLYSVGGRVKFTESTEQAVIREVFEETGVQMEIDRLGFIHENFFFGDSPASAGKLIHEFSFFYYMNTPEDFEPVFDHLSDGEIDEYLIWITLDEKKRFYPKFFREELLHPSKNIKHFITKEVHEGN